jgi:hypothetical protein
MQILLDRVSTICTSKIQLYLVTLPLHVYSLFFIQILWNIISNQTLRFSLNVYMFHIWISILYTFEPDANHKIFCLLLWLESNLCWAMKLPFANNMHITWWHTKCSTWCSKFIQSSYLWQLVNIVNFVNRLSRWARCEELKYRARKIAREQTEWIEEHREVVRK